MYSEKMRRNISDTDSTIAILMNALEVRDYRPENDALQLRDLVLDFARYLNYPAENYGKLGLFARFHDIGKNRYTGPHFIRKTNLQRRRKEKWTAL